MDGKQLGIFCGVDSLPFEIPVSCVVRRRLSQSGVYCFMVRSEAQIYCLQVAHSNHIVLACNPMEWMLQVVCSPAAEVSFVVILLGWIEEDSLKVYFKKLSKDLRFPTKQKLHNV